MEAEIDDLGEEVPMLNIILDGLSDMLEEQGVITRADWEKKIKQNLAAK